ncbi:hypothetical protein SAMN04490357_3475 [Streptomyces misionensis]|uniref:Uncharacterized protein n=1 Tax=Streptomyces misionensis TaxID=67331 RepID=A0A1H4X222_9ACTN|nr:hypothetical protein SAMN04490357_3475 [Streptomyces misionensis]
MLPCGASGTAEPPRASGPFEVSSAGASAVRGNWLPPAINAVFASGATAGGLGAPSSASLSGGANTVAGNGTERSSSSPAPPFVSVPAQGVAPSGTPAGAEPPKEPTDSADSPESPESAKSPESEAAPCGRRSPIPSLSAASCNHSGGVNRNDV